VAFKLAYINNKGYLGLLPMQVELQRSYNNIVRASYMLSIGAIG
jgi:hypothetical protein